MLIRDDRATNPLPNAVAVSPPLAALAPAAAANSTTPGTNPIPGRIPYGQTEINANPNTPSSNSAGIPVTPTGQNPNDPNACPVLNYTSSTPLAN